MPKTAENTKTPEKKELSYKRQAFVNAYDGNATEAAKTAGYSERTAYSQGQRLLKNVEVMKAIEAKRAASSRKAGITAEWLEDQTKAIAETALLATDRLRALDMLGRHLPAYYKQDTEQPPEQARRLSEAEQAEAKRLIDIRLADMQRRGSQQAGDAGKAETA